MNVGRAARQRILFAFSSLRERNFRWWFISQVFSSSGNITQLVALSWLVLQLTGSALDVGIVSAVGLLPVLVGGAAAGSIVDRVSHRHLLIVTQCAFISLGTLLSVITAIALIDFQIILIVAFATGVVAAFDGPARQVFVLDLVGRKRLASAVSLYEVMGNLARIIGPSTGGILLALYGAAACFGFNAATYVVPLVVLLRLKLETKPASSSRSNMRGGTIQGLSYSMRDPLIRACLTFAFMGTVLFNQGLLYPLLATKVLHLEPIGYGMLVAAFGLGAVPGAIFAASVGDVAPRRLIAILVAVTGVFMAATGLAPNFGTAFAATFLVGFTSIWYIASANTLVQLTAAREMRGRVMGIWTAILPGGGVVTGVVVGALANTVGVRATFVAVAVAIVVSAAIGYPALASNQPTSVQKWRPSDG